MLLKKSFQNHKPEFVNRNLSILQLPWHKAALLLFFQELLSLLCILKKWNQAWKQRFPTFFSCLELSRKEVFQPHLPVRLPCYDLAPVTSFTLGRSLRSRTSGTPSFHGLTGGVYKARERIHRTIADVRLLANPTSRSRVADFDPN
jgi:hypothetical protein